MAILVILAITAIAYGDCLSCHLLFQGQGGHGRLFAAYGAAGAIAELADIELELGDGARESIAVHAEFAGGLALIAFVLLKHIHDEALFEFADSFRIKNSTGVHLSYECFKLVLHGVLSFARSKNFVYNGPGGPTTWLVFPDAA